MASVRDRLAPFGLDVGQELGRGSIGVVHHALDTETGGRPVAVKVIDSSRSEALESLSREIDSAVQLRHPNLLTLHRARTSEDPRFLVLELADTDPSDMPLSLERTIDCGVKLCSALALAHQAGIVHSDIKPGNILWRNGRQPLLGDFGSARLEAMTRHREGFGYTPAWSPPWMLSPELADVVSDVWSLVGTLISFHWGWRPRQIEWHRMQPEDLVPLFQAFMPTEAKTAVSGSGPALDLGRQLQEYQYRRGWTITSFPDDDQVNWSPEARDSDTIHTEHGVSGGHGIPTGHQTGVQGTETVTAHVSQPPPLPIDPARPVEVVKPRRRWARMLLGIGLLAVIAAASFGAYRTLLNPDQDVVAEGQPEPEGDAEQDAPASTLADQEDSASADSGGDSETTAPSTTVGSETEADQTPSTEIENQEAAVAGGPSESVLVFASDRSGDLDIYRALPGEPVAPIVDRDADDYGPSLSPDGTSVVFESTEGGIREVYVAAVDGSSAPRKISTPGAEAAEPAWSPDGTSIAWASRARSNWDIVVYDVDSATETFVTTGASDDRSPAWSPDGTALVFRSDRTGDGDIYRLTLSNQSIVQVTSSPAREDNPAWSSGDVIAFERRVDSDVEVFSVSTESDASPSRRTTHVGFDGAPTFDGDRLIVVRRDGGESSIVIEPGEGETLVDTSSGLTQDLRAG